MASKHGTFYTTEKIGPKQSLTPEGFLLCEEVPVARTGMMIYGPNETPIEAGPDGIVKIFREDADVFRPETIASATGKPVADDHPDEDVTPENWRELTVGIMMNVRRGTGANDDLMFADLLVTTPEGIKAVQTGKREVSLGYEADYEELSPGTGKQTNIIINHVALVEQGRCGPRCAIGDRKSKHEKELAVAGKKHNKFVDALMRAFKAKDADEVEKIAQEAADEIEMGEGSTGGEGDTHIHVHSGDTSENEPTESGRMNFTDEDLQAHIDANAKEHAELSARIAALEERLKPTDAEAEIESKEVEDGLKDEAPEGVPVEEAVKAKDSRYLVDSFQDTVALAEILVPGIRVPTCDASARPGQTFKKICGLRKQALDLAYHQPATRSILEDLLSNKPLDTKTMTCDAARVLFRAAAAAKSTLNNLGGGKTADTSKQISPPTLASINAANRAKYSNS